MKTLDTILRESIPTDAMLSDDEIREIAVAIHVGTTRCGLTFEDFADADDRSCPDGGRPLDHPKSADSIEPDWAPLVTVDYARNPEFTGTMYRLRHHTTNETRIVSETGDHYGTLGVIIEDIFDEPEN